VKQHNWIRFFFLDDSLENNTNSTSSSSNFSSSFHPTTRTSQVTSLTKSRLVSSLPSLTKKRTSIPPISVSKAHVCHRGDIIDVHVHLHSTQDSENWVTFSHQKKLPIVIKCPNWSDYIKRGYLVRPIAFLAGKDACCTIYPFHEDEEEMSEEVNFEENISTSTTELPRSSASTTTTTSLSPKTHRVAKSQSSLASYSSETRQEHVETRRKWGSGGQSNELGMTEGRSSCLIA